MIRTINMLVYVYLFLISVASVLIGGCVAFGQELPPEPQSVVSSDIGISPEYPAYSLARFNLGEVSASVTVFTIWNGQVVISEAVETKRKGEFVFTGPPGKYTIRITTYDPTKGFISVTAYTTIKPATGVVEPVNPTNPVTPPTPVDPNTPSTGPPAEGRYGIGLVAYNWLVKNRPSNATAVKQLAANYEWAAKSTQTNIATLSKELKTRNDSVYSANPELDGLRQEMQKIAGRHVETGILITIAEFKDAYRETAVGIRSAYGE